MKLTTERRKKMPKSQFGLPKEKGKGGENKAGRGAYPVPDKAHARNAKARASQQYNKGNLTKAEKDKIDRKADRKLGEEKGEGRKDTKKEERKEKRKETHKH